MTWEAGGYPSDYCGGHVRMLGCLWGQLRGCLNVVTGAGESDCCVTGCSCNSGGGCHPLFLCSSVQGLWVLCGSVRCVPVTCNSVYVHKCMSSECLCALLQWPVPAGCLLCDTMTGRVCRCVAGVTGLVQMLTEGQLCATAWG